MKEHHTTPKDKLMEAVIKSVKEKYPDNPACFSFHGDTDNPHIHCDLKIQDINGKRIDVKIADLHKLRQDYAKNLRDLGIEAYATRRYEKYDLHKDKNIDTVQDKNLTGTGEDKIKNHHYEVVEFGKAKYKFDENSKDSYFVMWDNRNASTDSRACFSSCSFWWKSNFIVKKDIVWKVFIDLWYFNIKTFSFFQPNLAISTKPRFLSSPSHYDYK